MARKLVGKREMDLEMIRCPGVHVNIQQYSISLYVFTAVFDFDLPFCRAKA